MNKLTMEDINIRIKKELCSNTILELTDNIIGLFLEKILINYGLNFLKYT